MPTLDLYITAALAEIAGCFAVWAWLAEDLRPDRYKLSCADVCLLGPRLS